MDMGKMNKEKYFLFPKSKKGMEVMSVYWFLMLAIIAGGIFAMVYIFYGTPLDVRELEARILSNKIADCVSYGGRINPNIISEGNFSMENNFFEECHLNFGSEEWEDEQYATEIYFYKLEDTENSVFSIKEGNNQFVPFCALETADKNLVECLEKSFYSLDELNYQYIIKILTVVRKSEKNVKQ